MLSRTVVRVSLLVDYEEPPNIAVQRDRGLALLAARPLRAPQRGPDRMCRSPGVLTYDWTKNGGRSPLGITSLTKNKQTARTAKVGSVSSLTAFVMLPAKTGQVVSA